MLSKGVGVYHMPNQNTSIGKCPDDARFWHNGRLRTLAAVPQDADALQLAPGDFLFREGDKCDEMYVLLEGRRRKRSAAQIAKHLGQTLDTSAPTSDDAADLITVLASARRRIA